MTNSRCGLDIALQIVGGKWKPLILFHLNGGPQRFGELKRMVGAVSEKMLIQHLRELTDDGVVVRHDYREVPPRVDYALTALGGTLARALVPLCDWGSEHRELIEAAAAPRAAA
jgi:DNA-binding HxlR family transcriptional regulator